MASVTDWQDARAELIFAFVDALKAYRRMDPYKGGTPRQEQEAVDLENAAFDVAKKYGWDAQEDEDFMTWASKATSEELIAEGLQRALSNFKLEP